MDPTMPRSHVIDIQTESDYTPVKKNWAQRNSPTEALPENGTFCSRILESIRMRRPVQFDKPRRALL
jgi:hypothetical protein